MKADRRIAGASMRCPECGCDAVRAVRARRGEPAHEDARYTARRAVSCLFCRWQGTAREAR